MLAMCCVLLVVGCLLFAVPCLLCTLCGVLAVVCLCVHALLVVYCIPYYMYFVLIGARCSLYDMLCGLCCFV